MEGFKGNINYKTPEKIQAQVEAFADGGVKAFSDEQKVILKNSAELAKITDLNNLPDDLSNELRELIESNKEAYLQFLRERKYETEKIEESIALYNEKFSDVIASLKAKMLVDDPKQLPEYLGSGSNGSAFKIEVDGKEYAAKFTKSVTQSNFEIKPLLKAEGIEHVSQFVCHSFEDGVVVMELLPGTDVTNFTAENAPEYTDKDLGQLVDTVVELESAGLVIDPKASNFLYSPENGFSVLDYHLQREGGGHITSKSLMSLIHALTYRPYKSLDRDVSDYDEKLNNQIQEDLKRKLSMMVRVFEIVKDKYPELITEWQETYDRELAEYREKERTNSYPRGLPYNPVKKDNIPDSEEFRQYVQKLEELGIKT